MTIITGLRMRRRKGGRRRTEAGVGGALRSRLEERGDVGGALRLRLEERSASGLACGWRGWPVRARLFVIGYLLFGNRAPGKYASLVTHVNFTG